MSNQDFLDKLSVLLDAGPEPSLDPLPRKRRLEDIVNDVCEEGLNAM